MFKNLRYGFPCLFFNFNYLIEKTNSNSGKCQCTGLNLKILLKTIAGWILTLVVVGGTSALLVAQGVYAPSVKMNSTMNTYINSIRY